MKGKPSPILVTGAHRSGSTWVGRVLAKCPGVGYLHEPFNPLYPSYQNAPIDCWNIYLDENSSEGYTGFVHDTLSWRYKPLKRLSNVNNAFRAKTFIKYLGLYGLNRIQGNSVLLKDPIAVFSTPWLANSFGIKPVLLIRHPAAFYVSLKRKGWQYPFKDIVSQPNLINAYFSDEVTQKQLDLAVSQPQSLLYQSALIWKLIYQAVMQYQERYPSWIYVRHEDLSQDPTSGFKKICDTLGLEMTRDVMDYIALSTNENNPAAAKGVQESLRRNSAANASLWKTKLSADEVSEIKDIAGSPLRHFYPE